MTVRSTRTGDPVPWPITFVDQDTFLGWSFEVGLRDTTELFLAMVGFFATSFTSASSLEAFGAAGGAPLVALLGSCICLENNGDDNDKQGIHRCNKELP
jgi:hypothetical protein